MAELIPVSDRRGALAFIERAVIGYGLLPDLMLPRLRAAGELFSFRPIEQTASFGSAGIKTANEPVRFAGGFAVAVDDDVPKLAEFLRIETSDQFVLIEDVLARHGDSYLQPGTCNLTYVGDAVFYVLRTCSPVEELAKCIRRSRLTFGHSLLIVTTGGPEEIMSRTCWTLQDLERVAAHVKWLVTCK